MAKNKIITSQGNVQFINSKGKTINLHPMHCYYVVENDTISFLFIYMKDYSGQAFFASQFEDLEVNGETYDNMDDLKDAINYAFAKAGAQARTEIVDELPEDPFTNTIYLIKKEHGEGYDEYIWNEDEGWQLIGDTDIEWENYVKIDDFNPYSAATEEYIDAVSANTVQNASDIQFLSGAVDTEISDRETADTALSGAIDTVASNLADETTARTAADTALQNSINTVNGRVDAEQIARANADTALSGAIDSISGAVDTEVYARTAADEALDNKIDTVSGDVIAETSRAEGAEAALGERIDNETSDRTAADNALQTAINNEASARTAADEALSGAVDTVSSGLTEEAQRAQNAESALTDDINAVDGKVEALSGEVQTMGDEAIVDAEYVSSSTTIDFYNADGTVVASIDASDFIKDGMIEDVRIENGYLIIDFNTASGIEDIQIPLTDIFDPDNYYDKTAIDGIVSGLNDSIDAKFDASGITAYSTSQEVADEIEAATSGKVDTSDFETYSGAVETALGNKVETSDFETFSGNVETELGNKFDESAITAYSTTVEVGNAIDAATSGKVDTSDFTAYSASVETALSGKADASDLAEDEAVWGQALNDINSRINTISGDVLSSGDVQTQIDNSISGKQDTLSAGTNITIVDNVISAEGGGKAIEAGRGISVTTGETADTVSFNLPISAGTGTNSIKCGGVAAASGEYSFAIGANGVRAKGQCSFAGGSYSEAKGFSSMAFGRYNTTNNYGEVALGFFNISNGSSSAAGNSSGNTLFSVGNGTNQTSSTRHNAFEIRQNGDIYITSGGTDIKLQDNLGGGGSITIDPTLDSGSTNAVANSAITAAFDAKADVSAVTAVADSLSGYVTTGGAKQEITGDKTFIGSQKIHLTQSTNSDKPGFKVFAIGNTESGASEAASFEFRPNTFTIDSVQHPLLYIGHYRTNTIANNGIPQTVIGFRQYDQPNAAAYHMLTPLPEKAKTPFSLTTTYQDFYIPMGFKNGSTMIKADETGVADLSSELGGLKLMKITQSAYDALSTKDPNTLYIISD